MLNASANSKFTNAQGDVNDAPSKRIRLEIDSSREKHHGFYEKPAGYSHHTNTSHHNHLNNIAHDVNHSSTNMETFQMQHSDLAQLLKSSIGNFLDIEGATLNSDQINELCETVATQLEYYIVQIWDAATKFTKIRSDFTLYEIAPELIVDNHERDVFCKKLRLQEYEKHQTEERAENSALKDSINMLIHIGGLCHANRSREASHPHDDPRQNSGSNLQMCNETDRSELELQTKLMSDIHEKLLVKSSREALIRSVSSDDLIAAIERLPEYTVSQLLRNTLQSFKLALATLGEPAQQTS